jgi:branched-chain amino acid transport system permease protein
MLVLEELLRNWTEYWHMPLGILLLLVVFFAPKGLAGLVRIRSAADPATTAKEQA